MKAFWSIVLSLLIAAFSWIPGFYKLFPNADKATADSTTGINNYIPGYTNGSWFEALVDAFGLDKTTEYTDDATLFPNVTDAAGRKNVLILNAYGVLDADADADIKLEDQLLNSFMAATLVRITGKTLNVDLNKVADKIQSYQKSDSAQELAYAASAGLIAQPEGDYKDGPVSQATAEEALAKAVDQWENPTWETDLDVEVKDTRGLSAQGFGGSSDDVDAADPNADATDVFDAIAFQGNFAPELQASTITRPDGTVLNDGVAGDADTVTVQGISGQGLSLSDLKNFDIKDALSKIDWKALLKKINFSFTIPNTSVGVNVAVLDQGFRIGLSGPIVTGDAGSISIAKTYEFNNVDIATNLSAENLGQSLDYCYFRMAYDLTDKTEISGSAAGSLAVKDEATLAAAESAIAGLTNNITMAAGAGGKLVLFKAIVPIPQLPAITFEATFSLVITLDGKISITITTDNLTGFEWQNSKLRLINDRTVTSENYYIDANAQAMANLDVRLNLLTYCLIDAGINAGIGAKAYVDITVATADGTPLNTKRVDLPYGYFDTTWGANNENTTVTGRVLLYGILEFYYGKDSVVLKYIPEKYRYFKIFGNPDDASVYYPELSTIYQGEWSQQLGAA